MCFLEKCLYFLYLLPYYDGVISSNLFLRHLFVIKSTIVFVRIAMQTTVESAATALKTWKKQNSKTLSQNTLQQHNFQTKWPQNCWGLFLILSLCGKKYSKHKCDGQTDRQTDNGISTFKSMLVSKLISYHHKLDLFFFFPFFPWSCNSTSWMFKPISFLLKRKTVYRRIRQLM